jgi:hypothetical protein
MMGEPEGNGGPEGGADPMMSGPEGGSDPMMGGPEGGGDPMMDGPEGGADPMMGGPEGGADPMMGGPEGNGGSDMGGGAEGFNPEGGDTNAGLEGMGGENPDSQESADTLQDDDEVIDVDDLTKSQEKAERKIDKMNDKFEKLMNSVEKLIKLNQEKDAQSALLLNKVQDEIDKRIPTPQQRLSMRSTKSSPYTMTPNEYMNNYAPENYSDESDNNGADDAQYQITKDDIDRVTDYNSIVKDLDVEHQGLRDILGF